MASTNSSISHNTVGVLNTGEGNVNITGNIHLHQLKYEKLSFEYFPLPRLIETFRGRDDEMDRLDSLLFSEAKRKVVICGLPGFGKTELTKQFAQRCLNNGKVTRVLWIKAEKKEDVEHSYPKLKKIYEQCNDSCLCVFDNGLCRRDIADFEPPASDNFFMIVSSQEKSWGPDVTSVQLQPLSRQSAIDVFKLILKDNYKEEDYSSYVQLTDVVDNVPLGLQIIAGFVRQQTDILQHNFNLSEYVHDIQKSSDIMKINIPRDASNSYEKTIYGALEISLNKIKEEKNIQVRDLTLNMLYVGSYLNPDNIYIEDMLKISNVKSVYNNSRTQLELSLGLLVNYSLVNRSIGSYRSYIGMHRLVQKFFRFYLSEISLTNIYFSSCLYAAIFVNQFSRHTKSVASHADIYVDIVYDFYKKQISDVEKVLNWFVQFGCIACLDKIFEDKNERKYICHCNLLYTAIEYHQINILEKLLSYVIINKKYEFRYILYRAIEKGNENTVNILINHGANVHVRNKEGDTPLSEFIKNKSLSAHVNWKEILDKFQFDKNVMNNNEETILHLAAAHCHVDLIYILVVHYNININQQDIRGRTPLHAFYYNISLLHVGSTELIAILEVFIKHNASLDIKDLNGFTNGYLLLNYVVKFNEFEAVKWLLQQNLDVNVSNNFETVLHTAATYSNLEIIDILIEFGANVLASNRTGDTPLFLFINRKKLSDNTDWNEVLRLFQFDKFKRNKEMETLLHLAAVHYLSNLIEILLVDYRMNVNQRNYYNMTPLDALLNNLKFSSYFYANNRRSKSIIETRYSEVHRTIKILNQFIKHGASTMNSKLEIYLLNVLVEKNELQTLDWLLQHDVNRHEYCQSILEMAARAGNLEATKVCVNHGADIYAKDYYGVALTTLFDFYIYNTGTDNMDTDKVKDFLDTLDLPGQKHMGDKLLQWAAEYTDKRIGRLLMQKFTHFTTQI